MTWTVYILECADKTLYTGITNNLDARIQAHETGTGAKYTKGRAPLTLKYTEPHPNRSTATKREREIKKLSKEEKQSLIKKLKP